MTYVPGADDARPLVGTCSGPGGGTFGRLASTVQCKDSSETKEEVVQQQTAAGLWWGDGDTAQATERPRPSHQVCTTAGKMTLHPEDAGLSAALAEKDGATSRRSAEPRAAVGTALPRAEATGGPSR